ncbi:MAG: YggS family pyridoxal phosphate-dependent enzyme [Thermodesulfobacteriota bacterium]|nr:YggS family pyridoxal phosphate-dependent enzyme [Thermodesulfobacteriota bacterium]
MICDNLDRIRSRIQEAAENCGRDPQEIRLVAVSKRMPAKAVEEAYRCGQVIFGENYLQDARDKIKQLEPSLQWHFIGHLQSNKAKTAAEIFQVIETVDRLKIARALDRYAGELEKSLEVLIQVNVGREPQKSGVLPDETKGLLQEIGSLSNLKVRGLMTMPPYGHEPEASRPWFRELKQLADQLASKGLFEDNDDVELSMGMTGDFTVAIEEGATLVRVGTAIFGPRPN